MIVAQTARSAVSPTAQSAELRSPADRPVALLKPSEESEVKWFSPSPPRSGGEGRGKEVRRESFERLISAPLPGPLPALRGEGFLIPNVSTEQPGGLRYGDSKLRISSRLTVPLDAPILSVLKTGSHN